MKSSAAALNPTAALEKSWTAVLADLVKARLTLLVLLTTCVGFYLGERGTVNGPREVKNFPLWSSR